jgi:hypothetical protein
MELRWNCEKVSKCDAYWYTIIMEGKEEYPNEYIGWGDGTPDGTYKGTPVKFEELYYADLLKYNAVMIIEKTGSESEMYKMEKEQMDLNLVNKNKKYYNASRSNGYKMDIELTDVLAKIDKGEYEITSEEWDKVVSMRGDQVARSIEWDTDQYKWIKEQMNDTHGRWLKDNDAPVLVLRDYFGEGEHWRIGKRHTIKGISQTKFQPNLDVLWIPVSDWKKLERYDIEELAILDNPVQKNKRLENDLNAVANTITKYCSANNKDQTDPMVKSKLERMGYGPSAIKGLKVRIKNKLEGSSEGLAPNEIFTPTTEAEGIVFADGYRNDTTHSISFSSGYSGKVFAQMIKSLVCPIVLKKPNWVLSVYHSDLKNYNKWDKKKAVLKKDLANLASWLLATRGKGADEEIIKKVTFTIREKDPITLKVGVDKKKEEAA